MQQAVNQNELPVNVVNHLTLKDIATSLSPHPEKLLDQQYGSGYAGKLLGKKRDSPEKLDDLFEDDEKLMMPTKRTKLDEENSPKLTSENLLNLKQSRNRK